MTGVITIVNYLPAFGGFCRPSAVWQLPQTPQAYAHLSWPCGPSKALGHRDRHFSVAFQGTSMCPRPLLSEGRRTFSTGLIYRTWAVRILKGNNGHTTICSQSMDPCCQGICLNTSAWDFKCSMKERP